MKLYPLFIHPLRLILCVITTAIFSIAEVTAQTVYEPFDYAAGRLNGQSGLSEVGLLGTWTAHNASLDYTLVSAGSLSSDLDTAGGTLQFVRGPVNRFGGARGVDTVALAPQLANGTELWFSLQIGVESDANINNTNFYFALASNQFVTVNGANANKIITANGVDGEGVGFELLKTVVSAAKFDATTAYPFTGTSTGSLSELFADDLAINAGEHRLLVGRFIWGDTPADNDVIELYKIDGFTPTPWIPFSVLETQVAQQNFDTITFRRGELVVLDEIRIGATFADVIDNSSVFLDANQSKLSLLFVAFQEHIDGTNVLDEVELTDLLTELDGLKYNVGSSPEAIEQALDIVEDYEALYGPLFMSGSFITPSGFPGSVGVRGQSPVTIHWLIFELMQAVIDVAYGDDFFATNLPALEGVSYASSASFPGAVAIPVDASAIYEVTVDATYLNTPGRLMHSDDKPARKPTGAYLAPGSVATVTVPSELLNKGFMIRVGAHSWDLSGHNTLIKRLDRVSTTFNIKSETSLQIANPLGGGIYLEVPYLGDCGLVTLQIQNAVRSPYFSSKPFHQTSLEEWLTVEKNHPGPWVDIQSEQFMTQVPKAWIESFNDPQEFLDNWGRGIDASNYVMGFPRIRGKETIYLQPDVRLRASVYSPGYPAVNNIYNPATNYGGSAPSNSMILGPEVGYFAEIHELGHAYGMPKFSGETESTVNLPRVVMLNLGLGYDLDQAFRMSLSYGNFITLDTTAITAMTTESFRDRVAFLETEKKYQLKGHAKFVEIAHLFGWRGLADFYQSHSDDEDAGIINYTDKNNVDTDFMLIRMSESVGADVRPLFQFWGIYPDDNAAIDLALQSAGIPKSLSIYNRLLEYRALIPADNTAFRSFALSWHGEEPIYTGDPDKLITLGDHDEFFETYDEAHAQLLMDNVDAILDQYFPDGPPEANDYESWLSFHGYNELLSPVEKSFGSKITNEIKYFWGLSPNDFQLPTATEFNKEEGTFKYTRRDDTLTGATFIIQYSETLEEGSWQEDSAVVELASPVIDSNETVVVTLSDLPLEDSRLFIRVLLEE